MSKRRGLALDAEPLQGHWHYDSDVTNLAKREGPPGECITWRPERRIAALDGEEALRF